MRLFKAQANTINSHGGRYGYHPNPCKENLNAKFKVYNIEYEDATTKIREADLDDSCTEYLAFLFVNTSNNGRYRVPKNTIYNTPLMGKDSYQNNMEHALKLIDNYKIVTRTSSE